MMMHACGFSTRIAEAEETGVQGHSQLTVCAICDLVSSLKESVWLANSIFFTEEPITSCNPILLHLS